MLPHQMYGSNQGPSQSHGHKHRRRDLAKSHSNPSLGSTVLFESAPLPHVMGMPVTSSVDRTGLVHDVMMTKDPVIQNIQSGGFVPGSKDPAASVSSNKPVRPLWRKDWRPGKVVCAVPKLYEPKDQPSPVFKIQSVGETTTSESTALDFPRDRHGSNLTLHCIDLHAHCRHMSSLLSTAQSRLLLDDEPAPKLPDRFLSPASLAVKKSPIDISSRSPLAAVELNPSSLHKLLRKSTAAICAYTGYNDTSSQALDTLSTVLRDFLSNLTSLLHTNYDEALESGGRVPFADCLDQTLQHCGIEGKAELERYWKDSVKGLISYLDEEIRDTTHEYIQLTNPSQLTPAKKDDGHKSPDLWPTNVDQDTTNYSSADEEIPLDTVLEQTNMSNVLPTKTPDLEGPVAFTQFSDPDLEESTEGFPSLGLDGPPPTKRMRTISFGD